MKKVLITGVAGFIGSNLCDRLLKDGFFIYGLDNLITGSIDNIRHLDSNKNFEFINHDVTKYINLNDKTVAGITLRDKPIFGVQYHPEASPGPHDADLHFARFVALMEERR